MCALVSTVTPSESARRLSFFFGSIRIYGTAFSELALAGCYSTDYSTVMRTLGQTILINAPQARFKKFCFMFTLQLRTQPCQLVSVTVHYVIVGACRPGPGMG